MDKETFETLYQEMEKPLYNVVYRWVWQEQEAMDVVQEAFVKLWEKRQQVRTEAARAYVYRTALNLANNRLRYNKLRRWTGIEALAGLAAGQKGGEDILLQDERQKALRKAIESLPEKHRQVLLLCRFSGLSQAKVGELLGIPEGTVASRHHKAVQLLEAGLAHLRGGESWT